MNKHGKAAALQRQPGYQRRKQRGGEGNLEHCCGMWPYRRGVSPAEQCIREGRGDFRLQCLRQRLRGSRVEIDMGVPATYLAHRVCSFAHSAKLGMSMLPNRARRVPSRASRSVRGNSPCQSGSTSQRSRAAKRSAKAY